VDALGNPTSLHLTPGQASDLEEADALLGAESATTWIADKGYDADQRVLTRLQQAGKTAVIPPRTNRKSAKLPELPRSNLLRLGTHLASLMPPRTINGAFRNLGRIVNPQALRAESWCRFWCHFVPEFGASWRHAVQSGNHR
jgi:transposase